MIVKAISCAIVGIEPCRVEVEIDTSAGLPLFSTVGLPDASVKESKDRIRAAVRNSGYRFPRNHVTVNLAPADIRKEGTAFDLPIAVGILAAEETVPVEPLGSYCILGELSLDGTVKGVQGILSAAVLAKREGMRGVVVPLENAAEAALVEGIDVIPVSALPDVVDFFRGERPIIPYTVDIAEVFGQSLHYPLDFQEIRGQEQAKRALEVAAAGGHNIIMIGPPGAGKTMLAQRLPSILPPLLFEEVIETTKIFSVAGLLDKKTGLQGTRPFRAPHHTISDAGLIGGGQVPRPGEISLAHHGVLFLDELPEFKKNVLEALRQPLENGQVTITRSSITATYPARFMMVAAMNPCPCGHYGSSGRSCQCTAKQIRQYQARISGPLMDRIDIHIEVPAVRYRDLTGKYTGESSAALAARIAAAREAQRRRFGNGGGAVNARMSDRQIRDLCPLDDESRRMVEMAVDKLGLSARAFTRIIKVARTIADLEPAESIKAGHVAEAIQYRTLDRRIV